jgi:hypothetical protein
MTLYCEPPMSDAGCQMWWQGTAANVTYEQGNLKIMSTQKQVSINLPWGNYVWPSPSFSLLIIDDIEDTHAKSKGETKVRRIQSTFSLTSRFTKTSILNKMVMWQLSLSVLVKLCNSRCSLLPSYKMRCDIYYAEQTKRFQCYTFLAPSHIGDTCE